MNRSFFYCFATLCFFCLHFTSFACKLVIEEVANGKGDYLFKHSIVVGSSDSTSEDIVSLSYKDCDLHFIIDYGGDSTECLGFDYKMDGYSDQWRRSNAEKTELIYSSLPGGEYVLELKQRNEKNHAVFRLPIHVDSPFWETIWFFIFLGLILLALASLVLVSRFNRASKIKHVLEKQVKTRTKALEEKNEEIESQKEKIFEQRNVANRQNAKIAEQKSELERQRGELQRLVREQSNDLAQVKKQIAEKSKEVQITESKYQLLVENSRDMIFRMRLPEDVMDFVSPASVSLTGYSPEEFYKNSGLFRKIIAKESREKYINARRRILSGESIPVLEYKITTKNGESKWLSQRNVIVKGLNGEVVAVEAIVFDVTSQRKDAVANNAARIRAEESDKLKTAFLSSMSYEIRTPMNAIVGFADLLKEESVTSDERLQYVDQINNNTSALLRLIDDMVDLAKIEAGELEIIKVPIDIESLLQEVYDVYQGKHADHPAVENLEFSMHFAEGLSGTIIYADKERVKQILHNVVSNALRYTEQGYVRVMVTKEDDKQEMLIVSVRDSGPGIPAGKQSEIFDRYRYVRGNASKKSNGAGLGLAISRSLAELHGGTLTVESKLGQGSTFALELPIDVPKENFVHVAEATVLEESSVKDWSEKHILVAEDEDNNFKFMLAALKKTKITLIRARDGLEAVELFKEKQHLIDVVLMDIQMPKMNGYDATKELLKIDPDIPVIAQTAFAMSGGKIKCFDAGCIGYISKPYKAKDLIDIISKHIRQ